MIGVVLAGLSAIVWGTADFCGGKATQRAPALPVSVLSKLASLPPLLPFLVLLPGTPTAASLGWSAVAGMVGVLGMIVFYRALAMGAMVVVAPVSAVVTALVPLVVGLATERLPGPTALAGAVVAIVAITLVSLVPSGGAVPITVRLVGMSLAAGAGFGFFFVFLDVSGDAAGGDGGLWPIAGAEVAAIAFCSLLLLRTRTRPRFDRPTLRWVIAAGVLDVIANALYLFAVQGGLLSVVAPLAALYPASTVLLAMLVDGERIRPVQVAGLGLAATALVLVAS